MTELLFYHLQNATLESVLPALLEKSLGRGWRVVVQTASEERAEALDGYLWTYRDESFLPHVTWRERDMSGQPIVIAVGEANPNDATVRFLVEGAVLPREADRYERIVVIFDGDDEDAVAQARMAWKEGRARGFEATYWQRDARGAWVRRDQGNQ